MKRLFRHFTIYKTQSLLLLYISFVFIACKEDIGDGKSPIPFSRYSESISFQSIILNTEVKFSVYLPADYEKEKEKQYGTVYLLHGWGDNETAWFKEGKIDKIINHLEETGAISQMIYIVPQGFKTYYVDQFDGKFNYMQMFTKEFVPYIDSVFQTKAESRHRAVMGYSMGGYGALILPYLNPGLFSISIPLSMSWRTGEQYCSEPQSVWDLQWGKIFGGAGKSGEDRLTDYYLTHDPFTFFKQNSLTASKLDIFMDCGNEEEQLAITAINLHNLMRKNEILHQMRIRNGAHTWDYWRSGVREALIFISEKMNNNLFPEINKITNFASGISGKTINKSLNEINISITIPVDYEKGNIMHNTVYMAYSDFGNRSAEHLQIRLVLDSLQKNKNFIYVSFDVDELNKSGIKFEDIVNFIDANYRTGKNYYNRVLIGNKKAGNFLWKSIETETKLTHAGFFFDAHTPESIDNLQGDYYYISICDFGVNYTSAAELYLACREQNKEHNFRILNGVDCFDSFLYMLHESISHIGLKLNKY